MKYISTRGQAPDLPFDDVLLTGLARDGGLYVPDQWPTFSDDDWRAMRGLPYWEIAVRVMQPYVAGTIPEADFADMVRDAYAGFGHRAVAPMKQMGDNLWLMELFHGPTLAFKDMAMQILGRLFDYVLTQRGETVTIVGATSGDTGSAAIEACRDREAIECFILYPHGRVSDVQRRQMTTVPSDNVHCIALEGTFDDCQDAVKAMFNDIAFRDAKRLSAVNSINWARIMPQIAYYVAAAVNLGAPERKVSFAVPTGNFGNIFAAYAAGKMGLPIEQYIIGSNSNDILTRTLETGTMSMVPVVPTTSPSMDIQISSNFERLLFDLYGRDGASLTEAMTAFRAEGSLTFGSNQWEPMKAQFTGFRMDDIQSKQATNQIHQQTGELLDPHSIIGLKAAEACRANPSVPVVAMATAHPAKFPAAVEEATGVHPALPPRMSDLFERPERFTVQANDLAGLQSHISDVLTMRGPS
ncbi:threonine synthase [Magnetospira sp. QH-2]|uniref:threonine synthase n=1 Tax=Magnetospira sp. (strain QH-2) TaxID=1288970 RepID=UPI0003E81A1A|nr:threonine synthase [Magnetospira sp. QH-2]CCQ74653.1 threonine synthase [Magnetospira sp. QH-2]